MDSTEPKGRKHRSANARPGPDLAPLSIEVWRLGKRLAALSSPEARLDDSHRRLLAELERLEVRIADPLGQQFFEGTHADVIDMPDGCDPASERIIIADVLRPGIFVNGICVVVPQVLLAREHEDLHAN